MYLDKKYLIAVVALFAMASLSALPCSGAGLDVNDVEKALTSELAYRDSISKVKFGLHLFFHDGRLIEGRRLKLLNTESTDTINAIFMTVRGNAPRYMIYTDRDSIDFYHEEVCIVFEGLLPPDLRYDIKHVIQQYSLNAEIKKWNESDYAMPPDFDPQWIKYHYTESIDLYILLIRAYRSETGSIDVESTELFMRYPPLTTDTLGRICLDE